MTPDPKRKKALPRGGAGLAALLCGKGSAFGNPASTIRSVVRAGPSGETLALLLRCAIQALGGERGFLFMQDEKGSVRCIAALDAGGTPLEAAQRRLDAPGPLQVREGDASMELNGVQHGTRRRPGLSEAYPRADKDICVPLLLRGEWIGMIRVDGGTLPAGEADDAMALLELLASHAVLSIREAELAQRQRRTMREMEEMRDRFVRCERLAAKGELAAEISHELSNYLSVLALQVELLERSARLLPADALCGKLAEMKNLIKRIVVFAAALLEASALRASKSTGDLNACLREMAALIRPLRRFRNATLVLTLDDQVPRFPFDGQQISQVILNLVSNAVEARDDARVELRTAYDPADRLVSISISDNGPGIPEAIRARLFRERVTTKPAGHGYGLAVCMRIAENHGGEISASTAPGGGALFMLTLPVGDCPARDDRSVDP